MAKLTRKAGADCRLWCQDGDLIGAMGSAQLLDGFVCRPWQLDGEVDSPTLVDYSR